MLEAYNYFAGILCRLKHIITLLLHCIVLIYGTLHQVFHFSSMVTAHVKKPTINKVLLLLFFFSFFLNETTYYGYVDFRKLSNGYPRKTEIVHLYEYYLREEASLKYRSLGIYPHPQITS